MLAPLLALILTSNTLSGDDSKVAKIGRFVVKDGTAACAWSTSTVALDVEGTRLEASLNSPEENYVQVVVDGSPTEVLTFLGSKTFPIKFSNPGRHKVRFVKRTEAFAGPVTFEKFTTDGTFHPATTASRLIEFVGDSITCGFGNEGKTKEEPFKRATENAYMTYASFAGRDLGAEVRTLAWSGRKMWPDNTMPSIYDLVIPTDATTKVDWAKEPVPDVVVIHLATNDFGSQNPEQAGWTKAYGEFIARIREHAPKAMVYCALGSMMSDFWPPEHRALTTARTYLSEVIKAREAVGDHRVKFIEFDQQLESDGIGSSWHPNVVTHRKMANRLVKTVKADMGW